MPNWLIKCAIQRAISWLPASHRWNEFLQTCVTRTLDLNPARFEMRLEACRRHLEHFLELRPTRAQGFTVFDLGTGWYPVVPVGLYLCGAVETWTYDIMPLLSRSRLNQMLARFDEYARSGTLEKFLPRFQPERMARVRELAARAQCVPPAALLEDLRIHVLVQDARNTGLPSGTVDLLTSTGVLEYIPRDVLQSILRELRRLGSPDAVQSHYLNLVDQYSDFDRGIGPYNFLKFSSRRWRFLNSPLTWQNRLRISDYRVLFAEAGLVIVKEANRSGSPADLDRVRLAPEFRGYRKEDLLVLFSWLVAKAGKHERTGEGGNPNLAGR